ncbi:MAG TPA: bifunctional riboflavin kinase/FAD synthetase [Burkholderiaceae bacterium]|nr:bifunctional riboflavin kinase/FAD synthetase [Burkholderiaceae bacterium]
MQIFRGIPRPAQRVPCALTVGNFDGVHRGHRALLARVTAAARTRRLASAVMTFEPHPREFFAPQAAPMRISNLRDKLGALQDAGIDRVFIQHFNRRFAQLSATDFVDRVLLDGCDVRWLLVGDDFRFGAKRAGDNTLLQRYAAQGRFELEQMPTFDDGGERISSTAVRTALAAGDLKRAQHLLGRPYSISGRVLHGRKLGRSMGFPTLNLRIAHAHPAVHGVFAVTVHGTDPQPVPGVASIGLRPTVDDQGRWLLEVHLFDFTRDIYGALVRVEFVQKLREEEKYETLEALAAAIRRDAERARAVLSAAPA